MNRGSIYNRETTPAKIFWELEYAGEIGRTTAELQKTTGSMAVSTDVSAVREQLREHPYYEDIDCRYVGKSESGRKVYRYRLMVRGRQVSAGGIR